MERREGGGAWRLEKAGGSFPRDAARFSSQPVAMPKVEELEAASGPGSSPEEEEEEGKVISAPGL